MALATRIAVMDRGKVVQVGAPAEIYEFPQSRFVADFVGTTNLFEGTVAVCEPGLTTVTCRETGCDLLVDDAGRFSPGQRVWVALRPEKIRLSKQPSTTGRVNQLRGTVHELGYLGNRSTYQIKTTTGKLVTVFCQNERRTSEWHIDWSDEVYVSWSATLRSCCSRRSRPPSRVTPPHRITPIGSDNSRNAIRPRCRRQKYEIGHPVRPAWVYFMG